MTGRLRIPLRTPPLLSEQERWMQRQRRKLTVEDRVAIDLRDKDGWGVRAIARELGRSPSVIGAEIGADATRTEATPPGRHRPRRQRGGTGRDAGPSSNQTVR